jgi:hypothetical protein
MKKKLGNVTRQAIRGFTFERTGDHQQRFALM